MIIYRTLSIFQYQCNDYLLLLLMLLKKVNIHFFAISVLNCFFSSVTPYVASLSVCPETFKLRNGCRKKKSVKYVYHLCGAVRKCYSVHGNYFFTLVVCFVFASVAVKSVHKVLFTDFVNNSLSRISVSELKY